MTQDNAGMAAGGGKAAESKVDWSALLAAYRAEPKQDKAGRLLDGLGPWLTRARQRLVAVPPYLDHDDVAQQLVLEVLRIAGRWRPHCDDCWIPRKLVEAAERRVRKGLSRERRSLKVELDDNLPASVDAEPDLIFDTPVGRASADDLRILYRANVLGEPVSALAHEAGVTPRQMRRRVSSARKRARTSAAATGVDDA